LHEWADLIPLGKIAKGIEGDTLRTIRQVVWNGRGDGRRKQALSVG
jgi:hypothetical protein